MKVKIFDWTEIAHAKLRKLWDEGHSCAKIAAIMGHDLSRCAIIGKARRLKLPRRQTGAPTGPRPKPATAAKQKRAARPVLFPVEPYVLPANGLPPPAKKISLIDREEHHCRYPYGDPKKDDFTYCGRDRVLGLAYCIGHANAVYLNAPVVLSRKQVTMPEKEDA